MAEEGGIQPRHVWESEKRIETTALNKSEYYCFVIYPNVISVSGL